MLKLRSLRLSRGLLGTCSNCSCRPLFMASDEWLVEQVLAFLDKVHGASMTLRHHILSLLLRRCRNFFALKKHALLDQILFEVPGLRLISSCSILELGGLHKELNEVLLIVVVLTEDFIFLVLV